MGHKLTVAFANLHSCFVHLPPSWSNALWDRLKALKAGEVVLELLWADKSTGSGGKAFVGWAGGATTRTSQNGPLSSSPDSEYLELDAQYGRALGLREGQVVNVEFCKDVVSGTSVHVEPLTADDWEILELHAGYLEEQFLNQVRIVWKDQIITIWVHSQTLIKLKVVETNPNARCIKLDTDAEVIVAPKQRWKPSSNSKPDNAPLESAAPKIKTPSVGVRLLPTEAFTPRPGAISDLPIPTIFMSSGSWIEPIVDGQIVFIKKRTLEKKQTPEPEPVNKEEVSGQESERNFVAPEGAYVYLQCDNTVPKGHVWANEAVWLPLGLSAFNRLRVSKVSKAPCEVRKIVVQRVVWGLQETNLVLRGKSSEREALIDTVRASFSEIVQRDRSLILTDGGLLYVSARNGDEAPNRLPVPIIIRFSGRSAQEPTASENKQPKEIEYLVINDANVKALQIEVGNTITQASQNISTAIPVPRLGGIEPLLDTVTSHIKNRISRRLLRASIQAPALGGILLYGARGSGKTDITRLVAHRLSLDYDTLAYTLVITCTSLVSERIAKIKDLWQETIYKAAWHGPSIIVFDDLDRLIPAEQEHADSSRARQLSEIFLDMMAAATSNHNLVLVATCQQQTSIHPSLLSHHLFGEVVHVASPTKLQRQQILHTLMSIGPEIMQQSRGNIDLLSVAGSTEGYSPADLKVLVERTVHEAAIRKLSDSATSDGEKDTTLRVEQEDFVVAQKGYVPASLRGVKLQSSEVSWADIGGLNATKRTLLETLEWPTKYAAIFASCTLRLRSGLLLYGFPGCGKTLLASAVAKECGLNFISVKGPELLNKYIGASEQSVRDLFERASAAKPCVLFFDEFDSIAPRRGHDNTGVTDRVVNQMLTQMDGAEGLDGVYVLAATSRPDIIDPALLRPGRLDKSLFCGMPEFEERLEILRAVANKLSLSPSVDLSHYAERTAGYSGADLQALLYNAHLEAIHEVIDAAEKDRNSKEDTRDQEDKTHFVVVQNENEIDKVMTAAERGGLATRIESIHKGLRESVSRPSKESPKSGQDSRHQKTEILSFHIDSALKSTRPSISEQEKRRLQRIYDEFIGGKVGQEGVGQRATLA
ncbi:AAA family ATPase peroxin 1 [Spizellomyces punctatus DAOM BR117]|uniref:Peroxisomal ATPase PEX1 n=1 Tax=Spizellomyces punctatus (strain DAOM BR117) TaxID=645134 RepID=A0A0L0HNG8_SPIPD|nr:AAA family ATPase peroxin 1 [Spizellomyces punctatus DAOM BR117]KND02495.1 hypothetical protein SPPG_02954 [Spizellomyces punctatus DAOM BR117]|eukprot:XP_016610534.1 hypothetical protein SPPG_02954 [Spizellomyces punctatus DAOM BR117]